MNNTEQKTTTETRNCRLYDVVCRILFGLLMVIVSLNVGKWIAIGLFKLIMWMGILPYLEKFFGWFIF